MRHAIHARNEETSHSPWRHALSSADGTSDDFTFSGVSASFSFDIGGAITENLVLHARFSSTYN